MKNVIYYLALTFLWAIILVLLGIILVAIGGIEAPYYALVIAILQPRLWFISAGATLLLRPVVYKMVFGLQKSFNKTRALVLIVIGVIMVILTFILDYLVYATM